MSLVKREECFPLQRRRRRRRCPFACSIIVHHIYVGRASKKTTAICPHKMIRSERRGLRMPGNRSRMDITHVRRRARGRARLARIQMRLLMGYFSAWRSTAEYSTINMKKLLRDMRRYLRGHYAVPRASRARSLSS